MMPKTIFLGQGFQKSEHYRQTDRHTDKHTHRGDHICSW